MRNHHVEANKKSQRETDYCTLGTRDDARGTAGIALVCSAPKCERIVRLPAYYPQPQRSCTSSLFPSVFDRIMFSPSLFATLLFCDESTANATEGRPFVVLFLLFHLALPVSFTLSIPRLFYLLGATPSTTPSPTTLPAISNMSCHSVGACFFPSIASRVGNETNTD